MAFHYNDAEQQGDSHASAIMDVVLTYFATCLGCNLSVFLPVIISENLREFATTLGVITVLAVAVVLLIKRIMQNQLVVTLMEKYGEGLMKLCYLTIGIYVLFDSQLLAHVVAFL